jgi:hypothetical protein
MLRRVKCRGDFAQESDGFGVGATREFHLGELTLPASVELVAASAPFENSLS